MPGFVDTPASLHLLFYIITHVHFHAVSRSVLIISDQNRLMLIICDFCNHLFATILKFMESQGKFSSFCQTPNLDKSRGV